MAARIWREAAWALVLFLCFTRSVAATETTVQRVLFVGNSVTYVNSLPVIFEQVAQGQPGSRRYRADMYVRGGATLSQLAKEPALHELLDSGAYQVVVLQERGGDVLCLHPESPWQRGDVSCADLIATHVALADEARAHHARVLYLGTYQGQPDVSRELVSVEAGLSGKMGAPYLEISESLRRMQRDHPAFPWLYEDHAHPGVALTALMALGTYQALHIDQPLHAFDLCSKADLYTTRLRGRTFVDHDDLTAAVRPERCLLDRVQMQAIIDGLGRSS